MSNFITFEHNFDYDKYRNLNMQMYNDILLTIFSIFTSNRIKINVIITVVNRLIFMNEIQR